MLIQLVSFTWKMLPGRWAGLAGFPGCKQWGSFWWWRSTWQAGWTSRAAPDQTPQWRHRNPTSSPSLTDHSSLEFYQPPGKQCQMGSTWQDENSQSSKSATVAMKPYISYTKRNELTYRRVFMKCLCRQGYKTNHKQHKAHRGWNSLIFQDSLCTNSYYHVVIRSELWILVRWWVLHIHGWGKTKQKNTCFNG